MTDVAVKVENASKRYRVYPSRKAQLLDLIFSSKTRSAKETWALRDIDFSVARGEALGIIGTNGSGKSTLLELITGTIQPTEGSVDVRGRITALLELGTGFNLDYTGTENIILNGLMLGLCRTDIESRFDEIAAFADIGDMLDQPVKTYSSGMMIRLAFAVQVGVDPDVLIIDEALAVGDMFFRQKCYKRMARLRDAGCTLLLASHNMSEIQEFCQRTLVLNRGNMRFIGGSVEGVQYYAFSQQSLPPANSLSKQHPSDAMQSSKPDTLNWPDQDAFLDIGIVEELSEGWARCTALALCDTEGNACMHFQQGRTAVFYYEFEALRDLEIPVGSISLQNIKGVIVHGKNSLMHDVDLPAYVQRRKRVRFRQEIELDVGPGEYSFQVGFSMIGGKDYRRRQSYTHEELASNMFKLCFLTNPSFFVVGMRADKSPVQLLHYGVTNLPGKIEMDII